MRYLILLAGIGRRMGSKLGGFPKCLIDIHGEPLIKRLLRQIRNNDPHADIHVVLGYKNEMILPFLDDCKIFINPFFDITCISASLWFARSSFDQPLMVIHGDVVLSSELAADLFPAEAELLIAYDSSILDPKEINIAVNGTRVTHFGVNFSGYSGAYACVFKLSADAARMFADLLDQRMRRGFNKPHTYYFFIMRKLIGNPDMEWIPFDFSRYRWKEIDHFEDIAIARVQVRGQ